jgi:transmembrane sensor
VESFEKISLLILRSLREDIKGEDTLLLNDWIEFSKENVDFFGQFTSQDILASKLTAFREADSDSIWNKTLERIGEDPTRTPWRRTSFAGLSVRSWKYVAAAAMVLLIVGSAYLFVRSVRRHGGGIKTDRSVVSSGVVPSGVVVSSGGAVLPGSNRATLTLSDGSTLALNKLKDGLLAEQGDTRIEKTREGELSYAAMRGVTMRGVTIRGITMRAVQAGRAGDNTLSTPRGGQYKVVLADGTRVWLNVGSSLTYPAAFGTRERRVELRGEAYFEVARLSIPFKVYIRPTREIPADRGPGSFVEVLGTRFNIMAYDDEPVSRTTVFEGSIKINAGPVPVIVKPDQQAIVVDSNAAVLVVRAPGKVNGWVDGNIQFDGQELPAIMRQLSRWYDVDVEYAGKIPTLRLDGSISRSTPIEDILRILNIQGGKELEFRMDGKKIIVKNKLNS